MSNFDIDLVIVGVESKNIVDVDPVPEEKETEDGLINVSSSSKLDFISDVFPNLEIPFFVR